MKIFLAQINSIVGDLEGNSKKLLEAFEKGNEAGADIILTPELSLPGYPPRDLLDRKAFIQANSNALDKLLPLIKDGPALIVGIIEDRSELHGRDLSNSAVLIHEGEIIHTERKSLLPFYDVFDEARYFEPEPVENRKPIEFKGVKIGITICEDAWFDDGNNYKTDPVQHLIHDGAEILLNLSASPYFIGKKRIRTERFQEISKTYEVPFIAVNQVGGNDELIFDGHSVAINNKGELCVIMKGFKESFTLVDTENLSPLVRVEPFKQENLEDLLDALCLGLKDYLSKCGLKKVVLGLSGGLDSAVTASIAVRAIGKENVFGIAMPSRYNRSESERDAKKLADSLGIKYDVISIEPMLKSYLSSVEHILGVDYLGLTEENLQARIRGVLLMMMSNKMGSIVLSTGNKSELGSGYCTLYGDMCGGLSLISDVLKTDVFALARYINDEAGKEIIPDYTITRPPSAELRPGQKDEDSLPDYDTMDGILKAYVEQSLEADEIEKLGYDRKTIDDLISLIDRNEFKRRQASPGLKVASKSFGMGRRQPIASTTSWRKYI